MKVVLLHAFPLDERMWQPQREALAEHELVTPNLYGLGGSSMNAWAQRLLGDVEGDLALVGASMGGYAALAMARQAPERVRGFLLAGSRPDADSPERRAAAPTRSASSRRKAPRASGRTSARSSSPRRLPRARSTSRER